MSEETRKESWLHRHGNIFTPHGGSMLIHVQRESGLAHRTMLLRPWQVQALRVITSRWFLTALAVGLVSWAYLAVQAARVPLLQWRITHLEQDAKRLDTLQATLAQLQARYEQVQRMLSRPGGGEKQRSAGAAATVKTQPARDSASGGEVAANPHKRP